jgi:hypothetical protein
MAVKLDKVKITHPKKWVIFFVYTFAENAPLVQASACTQQQKLCNTN